MTNNIKQLFTLLAAVLLSLAAAYSFYSELASFNEIEVSIKTVKVVVASDRPAKLKLVIENYGKSDVRVVGVTWC